MPSSEKIISPGVFTNEIDQSFLPAAVQAIGAAIIGPTVKGPALVPTVVQGYSDFQDRFGDVFRSGSKSGEYYQYMTSLTAEQYLRHADRATIVRILDDGPNAGGYSHASAIVMTGSYDGTYYTGSNVSMSADSEAAANVSFKLHTHSHGAILNNYGGRTAAIAAKATGSKNLLKSGSAHNIRWEVTSVNPSKGTFSLILRRGDDTHNRKRTLESWNNVTLDPNTNNYIAKVIGDQVNTLRGTETEPYLQLSGSYPNSSKFVRVEVIKDTIDYLDENGDIRVASSTGSLPGLGSGSWHGSFTGGSNGWAGFDALGNFSHDSANSQTTYNFFENIDTNSQGYTPGTNQRGKTAYMKALNLLSNQDEYDINLIMLPGLEQTDHSAIISKAIDTCEDRGDCFVIVDPTRHNASITTATTEGKDYDSNYAAMYWPWVQIADNQSGTNRWVPPSVVMGGIYAFNDKVAHPWFAPAGLNRGGIDAAIQAERKLTHGNRDDLYEANINPIATFPGQGVTVFGQKTLQKKSSALDRVNVRRLLITVKKFIASSSRFLVFEQNNVQTRKRFLNIVNPYLEQVQANSGLNAFRVVMDETNNTADRIDRNIMYGQVFLQPTRTAEFVVLDFTVQPTGAAFPE